MHYLELNKNDQKQYLSSKFNISTGLPLSVDLSSPEFQSNDRQRGGYFFRSSSHSLHKYYTINDIKKLDVELAELIEAEAKAQGYESADNC